MGPRGPAEVFEMDGLASPARPAPDHGARRRRTSGSGLVAALIGLTVSAAAVSGAYVVLKASPSDDPSLRLRVDFQLECARVLREVAGLLADSTPAEGAGPSGEYAFRKNSVDFAIALEGAELTLRRFDELKAPVSDRVLGRHVESIEFEPAAADQLRVSVAFRRDEDGQVHSIRRTITVRRRPTGEGLKPCRPSCVPD